MFLVYFHEKNKYELLFIKFPHTMLNGRRKQKERKNNGRTVIIETILSIFHRKIANIGHISNNIFIKYKFIICVKEIQL